MINSNGNSARSLLDAAYDDLRFAQGDLLNAEATPNGLSVEQWVEKGDWLALAKQVGAEKVFFVNNNPVIVFAESQGSEVETLDLFNRIWCMSRPMFVFIARDGELAVHKLARSPVRTVQEWREVQPLDVVNEARLVAAELRSYRREQIESGRLFEDERFGTSEQRADRLLINDLKAVRDALQGAGLAKDYLKYAHSLIGRSIFIRYLEDREILPRRYFEEVAEGNAEWQSLLKDELVKPDLDAEMEGKLYPRVLSNHEFTYALFDKLNADFNGDMFPSDPNERRVVNQDHLNLLQGFLRGDTGDQQNLFFWAYKFDIIPVELISNIYEEFYHKEKGDTDDKGTHYTPGALVDFLLSQVLTRERLESNPRIADVATGSGIFLVESFRRIVRFKTHQRNGASLTAKELRDILRYQIAGVEIDREAIRVAAFSLYLALLHYQVPKDILEQIEQGMRLPFLLYIEGQPTDEFHFNNLVRTNAFRIGLTSLDQKPLFEDEIGFGSFMAEPPDVIVGNPPWGAIDKTEKQLVKDWCKARDYPVGDDENSQAFVWKALDLVREGGCVALLLSTGVLFKHHAKSQEFRRKWLRRCKLLEVVNFAHVRDVFFRKGIAPFASVVFQKNRCEASAPSDHQVRYWSAKKLAHVDRWQAVVLNRSDLRLVRQNDLRRDDKLWKIYWWGNDRDRALIEWLEISTPLGELSDENGKRISPESSGRGFQENQDPTLKPEESIDWFGKYRELPTRAFQAYGPLSLDQLQLPPKTVEHPGKEALYNGERLLIKRGISQRAEPKGKIVARVESASFSFRNSIHCIKLRDGLSWEYKTILAIFRSSLARYYYFLTSSTWGMWHFELHFGEIKRMPIRFPEDRILRERIVNIVNELQSWSPTSRTLFELGGPTDAQMARDLQRIERELDDAVFDLYELSRPEREQVLDLCNTGIEFFYNDYHSQAAAPVHGPQVMQGTYKTLGRRNESNVLSEYLRVFLQLWNRELDAETELSWNVIRPNDEWPMIAVTFSLQSKDEAITEISSSEQDRWSTALLSLADDLLVPYHSSCVYVDGMVRAVTESDIIIIKRADKRLWTRSMAREDVDAAMVRIMTAQEQGEHSEKPLYPLRPRSLA